MTFSAEIVFRLDKVKRGLSLRSEGNLDELRSGLAEIIEDRTLTLGEWASLSDIDFDNEADLYRFLDGCYAYFFGNREGFPVAPR
ncbi:hypothetical protein OG948_34935 (plasmid) [Embleya sp. NBC_00888]|uniref:hypothetical protein n=1 Tax=Embleya sp. NBC_00888 TaxID=2975960 RepID=UPI002F90C70B|nr:hypothetical protein OG948_34935 [Embleya sp. NBC_00888]